MTYTTKTHKKVERRISLYDLEGDISGVGPFLEREAEGLLEPTLVAGWDFYEQSQYFEVVGWVPLTEKELVAQKKRSAAAKVAAKKRAEKAAAEEERELERLAKKLGKQIV